MGSASSKSFQSNIGHGLRKAASASVLTLLASTTVLTASGDVFAASTCPTRVNGTVTEGCFFDNEDATVTARGRIEGLTDGAGILTDGYDHRLVNDGTVIVSTSADDISGINIDGDLEEGGSLTNNGTVDVTLDQAGYHTASGLFITSYTYGELANNGDITVNISDDNNGGIGYGILTNGGLGENASLTNSGDIYVNTDVADDLGVAVGIAMYNNANGPITNSGTITTIAHVVDYTALARGIYVYEDINSTLSNSGTIDVTASATGASAVATGIYVDQNIHGSLTNSGTINATATAASSSLHAIGIYVGDDIAGSLVNSGTINVSADITVGVTSEPGRAYGVQVGQISGSVINNGTINVTHIRSGMATDNGATGAGIRVANNVSGSIINNGTISTSSDVTNDATDYGIYVNGTLTGSITNNGTITSDTVAASTAYSFGISADTVGAGGSISNSGTISINAQGAEVSAYGIYALNLNEDGIITNNGTIIIDAVSSSIYARAYGMMASNIRDGGTLINNGNITVNAEGGSSNTARGISASLLEAGGSIVNNGTVIASTPLTFYYYPYSIYVDDGAGIVENNGILSGHMYLGGTIDMENSGNIILPFTASSSNKAQIGGDYTQSSTGVLSVGVYNNSDYAQMEVGGTANFNDGNKIRVLVDQGNGYTGYVLSDVVTAGAITATDGFITEDNSLLWDFESAVVSGDRIEITASASGLSSVTYAVGQTGLTSGLGAAGVIDDFFNNGEPLALTDLMVAFGGASTDEELSAQVEQLLPLMAGGVNQVLAGNLHTTQQIVDQRLSNASGLSSGDNFVTDRNFWLKPFGSLANQDDRNGTSGYDATTGGLALGADSMLSNDKTRLGGAFVYSHSDVDSNSSAAPQNDRIDGYQGIVYGSYALDALSEFSMQADAGYHSNNGRRSISMTGDTAHSDYDSWTQHLGAGVNRKYSMGSALFVPSARVDYAHIRSDSYTETGAGALNMNVGADSTQELIFGADGKVQYPLAKMVTLSANLGAGYDVINDAASITSSFAGGGSSFITRGIDPSPWIGRGGLGFSVDQLQGMEITARYDVEAREDFSNQTASLKFKMPF